VNLNEKLNLKRILKMKIVLTFLIMTLFTGCTALKSAKMVNEGRQVKVDYSCVTENKELIATTSISDVENSLLKKSNGFIEHDEYGPIELTAGQEAPGQWDDKLKMLEPEILSKISFQLPGMEIGEEKTIVLESEIPEGMKEKNRYRVIERVRKAPRIHSIPLDQYKKMFGDSLPAPGDIITTNGKPTFKVLDVSAGNVKLDYIAHAVENNTPWGKAVSRIEGDMVVTTIEAVPGTIVKAHSVIGQVSEVTEDTITVDYGHPFAGKTLTCRVKVLGEKKTDASVKAGTE
jgi:FKBP-type peptidyl-prolyl cis-trans isomerase 2